MSALPPTQRLADLPNKMGPCYSQQSKPYVPWTPTDEDLWTAHYLLTGKDEWAVPGPKFLVSGSVRRSHGKG